MLASCRNGGVGFANVHEKKEWRWQSIMGKGNKDGEKLINNGSRNGYNESDERNIVITLQKEVLTFRFLFLNFFFMPIGNLSKKSSIPFGNF
jgi:hypothetical protein